MHFIAQRPGGICHIGERLKRKADASGVELIQVWSIL